MSFVETHWPQIFAAIVGLLVTGQLLTGVALGGRGQRSVRRIDYPGAYWTRLGFQTAVLVVVLVTGKTHWSGQVSFEGGKMTVVTQQSKYRRDSVPPPRTAAQRERAYALHNAHEYAQAVPLYDSILASDSADSWAHLNRGTALWNLGRNEEALTDFRRVMALDSTNLDAPRYADQLLAPQGRWDEIVAIWTEFIARNPRSAVAYYERGGTYFHKGERAAALADASKACELGHADACRQAERLR